MQLSPSVPVYPKTFNVKKIITILHKNSMSMFYERFLFQSFYFEILLLAVSLYVCVCIYIQKGRIIHNIMYLYKIFYV